MEWCKVLVSVCLCAVIAASPDTKQIVYSTKPTFMSLGSQGLGYVNTTTGIMCARECTSHISCVTFYFDKDTKQCFMSEGVETHGKPYGPYIDCPEEKGYFVYVRKKVFFCLKYNSTRHLNVSTAMDECQTDGGHLLIIENEESYHFVADILTSVGETRGIWLDGSDVYGNDTFYTSHGDKIPFVAWGDGDPYGNIQDCLRLALEDGVFKFMDIWCENKKKCCEYSTLCEIGGWRK